MTNEVKQIKAEMDSLRSSLKDKADENADLLRRIKSMTDEIVSIWYSLIFAFLGLLVFWF